MMISMDEVIAEVARKNGHGLAPDDPALFLITVVNCIAEGYGNQVLSCRHQRWYT